MTPPTFSCRNTLQRLRETHDQHMKYLAPENHQSVKVQYTVIYTDEDGNRSSYNKERTLINIHTVDSDAIAFILTQDFYKTDQSKVLFSMNMSPNEQNRESFNLTIVNISRLDPTGDDDQM